MRLLSWGRALTGIVAVAVLGGMFLTRSVLAPQPKVRTNPLGLHVCDDGKPALRATSSTECMGCEIEPAADMPPFFKRLRYCGLVFASQDRVKDGFLLLAGAFWRSMLRPRPGVTDDRLQRELVRRVSQNAALLPVMHGENVWALVKGARDQVATPKEFSVCDNLLEIGGPEQVLEIEEHLIHYLTVFGLREMFPGEWGLTDDSIVGRATRQATADKNFLGQALWDARGKRGRDMPRAYWMQRCPIGQGLEIHEFAFWFIATEWGMHSDTGAEWRVANQSTLAQLFPGLHEAYSRTVMRVMSRAETATLQALGRERGWLSPELYSELEKMPSPA
jgi:hypothetical protein